MIPFICWWLAIQLIGLAALPVTARVMRWLPGRGYAFSKVFGLLLVSYFLWLGALSGVLVNDLGGIAFALLLTAGLSAWAFFSVPHETIAQSLKSFWRQKRTEVLVVEALFFLVFAGWTLLRAYAPDKILPSGGEKYMEIAFLNGVLNSPSFPPLDPWLSGYGISYYYFGYVMMAVMTRLAGSSPTVGFDLYDALLFGLTAVSAYGVVSGLVSAAGGKQRAASTSGLLGALFVGGLGNLQGLLEGLYSNRVLPHAFWQWLDIPGLLGSAQSGSFYPGDGWWWWRASRVLHDVDLFYQPVPYQPIDEFPFFSFLLGDNHPHKLALPFVLLCVGLALNLLLSKDDRGVDGGTLSSREGGFLCRAWSMRGRILFYLPYALALGSLGFLNTWDLPVYLLVFLLAYGVRRLCAGEVPGLALLGRIIALGAGLGAGAFLLYLFFYLGFSSQAGGIIPYVFPPTRLSQYLVMFGPFIFILAFFLVLAGLNSGQQGRHSFPWREVLRTWAWLAGILLGLYLLTLLAASALLFSGSGEVLTLLNSWGGELAPCALLGKVLGSRLANPWLFLLLSVLLSLAITAVLHSSVVEETVGDGDVRPLSRSTLFALLLAAAGLGLTLAVEFFYLRDLFGMRMNTVFKFYFQGWVLMACASAYAIWWVNRFAVPWLRRVFLVAAAVFVVAAMIYPLMSIRSRVESLRYPPILDAAASVAGDYPGHWAAQPADWAAIQWINANIRPSTGEAPIILEAPGGGYENYGRVSAFTGLPTLLGWTNHEWQWRGNDAEIRRRLPDIEMIYTTASAEQALELLDKWDVRYVIVGEAERQFIQDTCAKQPAPCDPNRALAKFERAFTPVYSQQGVTVYQVR